MLSLDVIDLILSFLQWDRAALTSCSKADSLLCKIAERHLYAHITVEGQDHSYGSGPYIFDQFRLYKLLRDKPRIKNYVRSIHVQFVLSTFGNLSKEKRTLHLILAMLPLLESIALASHFDRNSANWTHLPKKFQKAFMDCLHLPTIKELSLSDITDFPLPNLDRSRTLKKLTLRGRTTFENPDPSSPRPSFDALSLFLFPPIPKIISWAKTQTPRSLEIGPESYLIVLPLLRQVWAPSLTSLNLDLGYQLRSDLNIRSGTPISSPLAKIPFPKLPILEQITVRSIISVENYNKKMMCFYKSALPTIVELIFDLTPPSLKRITLCFHLYFSGSISFSDVDWSPLGALSQLGVPLELRISANGTMSHMCSVGDILMSLRNIDSLSKLEEQRALVLKGEEQHPFGN